MKIYSHERKPILLIAILLGLNMCLLAQDTSQIVSGTIRNSTNYNPISFAIVKNEMLNTRIISDEFGKYSIPFNRGDLLKITAIGYEDGFYIVNDSSDFIADFPIQLKPRIYELKEFTLTPYKTVMQFKHAFANLVLPEENPKLRLIPIITPNIQTITEFDKVLGAFGSPISFLYNTFSHSSKMARKYNTLIDKDNKSNIVEKRLKQVNIENFIVFKSEEEMKNFIAFCQFDFSFLENMSDYELIAIVQKKYSEYLQNQVR